MSFSLESWLSSVGNVPLGNEKSENITPTYYITYFYLNSNENWNMLQKWIFSIIACLLVGLSGIFPLFLFSDAHSSKTFTSATNGKIRPEVLKYLLNFAVGSLLGDVFLHLLPEAWDLSIKDGVKQSDALQKLGFWILIGITSFLICEVLGGYQCEFDETKEGIPELNQLDSLATKSNQMSKNNPSTHSNCSQLTHFTEFQGKTSFTKAQIAGYLNLIANAFDNFTHGLAVAGSFVISPKIGILTTLAILFHEIPHEIGDFAILLRSGFNPWAAARAQLTTATLGLLGAILTLSADSLKTVGNYTSGILPFTAGCFIHISLSSLLPELLKEENPKESIKQLVCLVFGIGSMAFVSQLTAHC